MAVPEYYNDYLKEIKDIYGGQDSFGTEMSGRAALEKLFNNIAEDLGVECSILHEPRKQDGFRPDFEVKIGGVRIGYVEVKSTRIKLDRILDSSQIKNYRAISDNLMLTNYHEFLWIKGDNALEEVKLFDLQDLERPSFRIKAKSANNLHRILLGFIKARPASISDLYELADALAIRTRYLKEFLDASLRSQIKPENEDVQDRLVGLYNIFQKKLYAELNVTQFSDTCAQMLTYGLFLARISDDKAENITLQNVGNFIPKAFSLIREFIEARL